MKLKSDKYRSGEKAIKRRLSWYDRKMICSCIKDTSKQTELEGVE